MAKNLVAAASVDIHAPVRRVWEALTKPETIRHYMFGTTVVTDWQEGHPILWRGEWKGKPYEDKGVILIYQPEKKLAYTHYSSRSGLPDDTEHRHTVTLELSVEGDRTKVVLTQDHSASEKEQRESEANWKEVLNGLRKLLEY